MHYVPATPKTDLSDLNDEQRRAVTSDSKQLLVLAGAGSGKTKDAAAEDYSRDRGESGGEIVISYNITDIFTAKKVEPIKVAAEPVRLCSKCYSKLEKMWVVCPWCGEGVCE